MPKFKLKILTYSDDTGLQAGGLKFAFFFAIVLFAAINTGNNLIYLVLSSLCGAVLVSWTLAWLSLKKLHVRQSFPEEIFSEEETPVDFFVSKGKSLSPGLSLKLSLRGVGNVESQLPYIDHLQRESKKRVQGIFRFKQRGNYLVSGALATCNFPFGLISLRKFFKHKQELTIFPAIVSVEELLRGTTEDFDALDSLYRGNTGGLVNVRPFAPGDDYRLLHWKATAKVGDMMVKELAREESRAIWLHFNPLRRGSYRKRNAELFEMAVKVAASIAYYGRREAQSMMFSAPGLRLVPSRYNDHFSDFFKYLATISPSGRLLSSQATIVQHRTEELVVVIDPFNIGVDWGMDSLVFDRNYFRNSLDN